MPPEKYYAVQVFPEDTRLAAEMTSVPAKGPIEAARIVLGEDLSVHGTPKDPKVRVWELRDDFTTNCLEFYRKTKLHPAAANEESRGSMNVHLWIGLVAFIAVSAGMAAILYWGAS